MDSKLAGLLEAVSAACANDASAQTKACGAVAAKTLHTLLSATSGAPLVDPSPAPTALGQAVQQMRHAPQTVVLDALIAKLQSMVPKDEPDEPSEAALNIPFVRFTGGKL